MVGYGQEDNHFVVELTYNYGIKNYKKGNDFQVYLLSIAIWSLQDDVFTYAHTFNRSASVSTLKISCREPGLLATHNKRCYHPPLFSACHPQ